MVKKAAIILFSIALLVALVSTLGGGTRALPNDSATSRGNTLSAGVWHQSECLSVDSSQICVGLCGRCLCGIKIANACQYDITIDKVRLSWEPDDGENVVLMQVWFHDWIEWLGSEPSGSELDIDDLILNPGDEHYCVCFCFDSDMHGKSFTLEFIMGDDSTVTATFEIPARLETFMESGLPDGYSCDEECCEDCCPGECQLQP